MQLFEIIRWGNDLDDPFTGGPNGPDTCFLVRAMTLEQAANLADQALRDMSSRFVQPWSQCAYLLGSAAGDDGDERILRGPYLLSAYNHGWRQWQRNGEDGAWAESRQTL